MNKVAMHAFLVSVVEIVKRTARECHPGELLLQPDAALRLPSGRLCEDHLMQLLHEPAERNLDSTIQNGVLNHQTCKPIFSPGVPKLSTRLEVNTNRFAFHPPRMHKKHGLATRFCEAEGSLDQPFSCRSL